MVCSYGDWFMELVVITGLIGTHVVFAFYMVFLTQILSLGANPLFLVVLISLATAIVLLPFAVALEKKKWPQRLSTTMMTQLVLISLGGVTLYQTLMLLGDGKTSPAIASAMPNLAPGFTFIIAVCVRFERIDIRCNYSRAKILGTLLCLSGAIAMSFLQSPSASHKFTLLSKAVGLSDYKEWIIGCMYLLAAVVILACTTVLQAAAMHDYPAPISLSAITFFLGSIFTALVQIIKEGKLNVGSPLITLTSTIGTVLVGATVNCVCVTFQTWCIHRRGPVLVSMFSPIQTVSSIVLSAIMLKQLMSLGSITGMFLMFAGLYMVLWAKKKETCNTIYADEHTRIIEGIEKALLS